MPESYSNPELEGKATLMSDATVCPLLLIASPDAPSEEIDAKFLRVAKEHIDRCRTAGIKLSISRAVLLRVMELFPWHLQGDPVLRQLVTIWRASVLTPLLRLADLIECVSQPTQGEVAEQCAIAFDMTLSTTWVEWLTEWTLGTTIGERSVKGIAADQSCQATIESGLCGRFTLVFDAPGWEVVLHPWYHRYPNTLPATGQVRFVPPPNWRTGELRRGLSHGFVDSSGREWVWDKGHNDHWDVVINPSRPYRRISPDGRDLDAEEHGE